MTQNKGEILSLLVASMVNSTIFYQHCCNLLASKSTDIVYYCFDFSHWGADVCTCKMQGRYLTLEPLQNKNRQMKMPTFRLMKDQALTKLIQMFPPKPRRIDGRRPVSTQFERRSASMKLRRTRPAFYAVRRRVCYRVDRPPASVLRSSNGECETAQNAGRRPQNSIKRHGGNI